MASLSLTFLDSFSWGLLFGGARHLLRTWFLCFPSKAGYPAGANIWEEWHIQSTLKFKQPLPNFNWDVFMNHVDFFHGICTILFSFASFLSAMLVILNFFTPLGACCKQNNSLDNKGLLKFQRGLYIYKLFTFVHPSVCLSYCLSAYKISEEPVDSWCCNLVCALKSTTSRRIRTLEWDHKRESTRFTSGPCGHVCALGVPV